MTRISRSFAPRLGLLVLALTGTSLSAQAQSSSAAAGAAPHDPATISVTPRRPEIGSLVLLSIRRASGPGDSIVSITGWMAGEPLHFREDSTGVDRAFGLVPLEASDSVVARVVVRYHSGDSDTIRSVVAVPHRVIQTAGRPARARRLRVSRVFTARPDSMTEARIERENE